jgi:aspartate racemase
MKTPGIIGGIGPESTIEYYRQIIARYRERTGDGSYPPMIINSIDMNRMRNLIEQNRLAEVIEFLLPELEKLARIGADFGLLAAVTPHIIFDELRSRSPVPLISIVEVTCEAARRLKLKRVGLFGTRYTMTARFFPNAFAKAQIALSIPGPAEQDYIHEKYFSELVNGIFLPETRQGLLAIVDRLIKDERTEGLILGGTELPLILGNLQSPPIPFLDTTRLHVEAIVAEIFRS